MSHCVPRGANHADGRAWHRRLRPAALAAVITVAACGPSSETHVPAAAPTTTGAEEASTGPYGSLEEMVTAICDESRLLAARGLGGAEHDDAFDAWGDRVIDQVLWMERLGVRVAEIQEAHGLAPGTELSRVAAAEIAPHADCEAFLAAAARRRQVE